MPVDPNTSELERQIAENKLIDIELPTAPGIDWLAWLQIVGSLLLTLAVILIIAALMAHFWQRVRLNIRIKKAQKQLKQPTRVADFNQVAVQTYQWYRIAIKQALLTEHDQMRLQIKIDQACFSKTSVSRETLEDILQDFESALQATQPTLKAFFKQMINQGFEAMKQQLAAWKREKS
ncbi:hypothetical protein P8629_10975 [Hydrogenovibrio sp. 3SP14C1]|uniref:hypothetical protein n=1 Tax=Hydrogenovibrio sp. 3SP14C1 TaxID=3038774 RepID=UPI002415B494|nr:hypothetical protein [Hydrogenovibrio sp. 3SP14C1]MDG4813530.1 hypothetical protein [Hydrogenovibrio sp. 3SP14C1]